MIAKKALCNKIHEIYPEIGACGRDLKVTWDDERNVWAIDFKKDGLRMKHYLENEDAAPCLEGRQCVSLGIELGQFL